MSDGAHRNWTLVHLPVSLTVPRHCRPGRDALMLFVVPLAKCRANRELGFVRSARTHTHTHTHTLMLAPAGHGAAGRRTSPGGDSDGAPAPEGCGHRERSCDLPQCQWHLQSLGTATPL
jgi:hypothetical protein